MVRPAIVVVLCLVIMSSWTTAGTAVTPLGQFGLIKALDVLDIMDSAGATLGLGLMTSVSPSTRCCLFTTVDGLFRPGGDARRMSALIELRRDIDEHWFTLLGAGTTTPKAWDFGPLASVGVGQHLDRYDLLFQVTRGFIGGQTTKNTTVRIALEFPLSPKSDGKDKVGDTSPGL